MGSSCSNILLFKTPRAKTQAPPGDRTDISPHGDLPSADEAPPSQDAPCDEDAPDDENALDDEDAASKYRR